jgi:predicted NUDIX family NTP pyrophosphohydrolase
VFLAHPGGPLFVKKDEGAWTIPKGEVEPGEELLPTALREFEEETGIAIDAGSEFIALGSIQQKGGKMVHAWAVEKDWDDTQPVRSNMFEMEWPPGSGRMQEFPEVDRAQFFPLDVARRKIKERQWGLIERLVEELGRSKA